MFHKSQVLTISFLNTNWSILKLLFFLGLKFFAIFHRCCFLLDQNYSEVIVDWRQILFCCYIYSSNIAHPLDILEYLLFTKKTTWGSTYITYNSTFTYSRACASSLSLNYSVYIFIHLCLSFLCIFTVLLAFSVFFFHYTYLIKMKKAYLWCCHNIICNAMLNPKKNYDFNFVSPSFIFFILRLFYFCASKSFFMIMIRNQQKK